MSELVVTAARLSMENDALKARLARVRELVDPWFTEDRDGDYLPSEGRTLDPYQTICDIATTVGDADE